MTVKSMTALWFLHDKIQISIPQKIRIDSRRTLLFQMKLFYKHHGENVTCGTHGSSVCERAEMSLSWPL